MLSRLNPINSLFGRIFIWFWSAILVMVLLAFVTARYFSQAWELSAPDTKQLSKVERIVPNISHLLDRGVPLDRALRRVGIRSNFHLMSIEPTSGRFEFGFPPMLVKNRGDFLQLSDEQSPFLIRTSNMEFIGPLLLKTDQVTLQIYVGKLLRRDERPAYIFGAALSIVLLVGTLACLVISWNLAKPLKQLSQLSKRLASNSLVDADVTLQSRKDEIGQLHKDVFDMANKLAESLEKQKDLMANISHELRTPLTRLQLAVTMLNPTAEQIRYANRIEKDIGIMDALISQALQLAKLHNDNSFIMSEVCEIKTIITPLFEDLEFEARAKNINLKVTDCPQVELTLNKASFISALENIIRNGINYCKSEVRISLEVCTEADERQSLIVEIDDDGDGIEQKSMSLIFSPFFRAHQSLEQKGTGLGLTIAKTAIEMHSGNIIASKSVLGGLHIRVSIPIVGYGE